jgi:membrane fusion protein (multidrug efflux system)
MNRLVPLGFVVLTAAAAAGCRDSNAAAATAPPPPPAVSVVTVRPERVALAGEWIATLDGTVNAQIRPQVSGYLLRRAYREGAYVRKGELLFEIDRRPLEAVLGQARARLAEARAQLAKSERDLERDRPLAEQRAIAQSQVDDDLRARDAARAALASAEASVESAELNLRFTRVTSLIDGIAAIASAQIGDLVGPATLLTTVSQVDPIKVYFPIGEQEYLGIAAGLRSPAALARLWQEDGGLALVLADGRTYAHRGTVVAVDREVDPKMGTIRLGASFPNPGNVLRPGQFGRVRAQTGVETGALLVPQRAVAELQGGHQVRVVKADGVVEVRPVKMGRRVDARWIVASGLQAGDRVVVDAPSLRAGKKVVAAEAERCRVSSSAGRSSPSSSPSSPCWAARSRSAACRSRCSRRSCRRRSTSRRSTRAPTR